jgi:cob(I)alamin adenosyltransferase
MTIYTRTGDDGTTGLLGGQRVRKNDLRIECCGTVDELNATLGLAAVRAEAVLVAYLREVQNDLFTLGAHLGTPANTPQTMRLPPLDTPLIARLEQQIDQAEKELPNLTQFILPGGGETGARLHLARAICRRAERVVVKLALQQPVEPLMVPYLNRLSDWLFVMARLANHHAGLGDVVWQKPGQSA